MVPSFYSTFVSYITAMKKQSGAHSERIWGSQRKNLGHIPVRIIPH